MFKRYGDDSARVSPARALPPIADASAWYFGNMMLLVAIVVALTGWAAYTATAGRLVRADAFN